MAACNSGTKEAAEASTEAPKETEAPQKAEEKPAEPEQKDVPIDNSESTIAMMTQEYIGDNIAEIPMISYNGDQPALEEFGGKNPEIEPINNEIKFGIQQEYNSFNKDNHDWIEIKTYPFVDSKYVQAAVTKIVYPTYANDGEVFTINFDKAKNARVTVEDMLNADNVTKEQLIERLKAAYDTYKEIDGTLENIVLKGFIIMGEGSYTEYLIEAVIKPASADMDEQYRILRFSLDGDVLRFFDSPCLFDPASTSPQFDPPLKCQQGEEEHSDSGISLKFDTQGLTEVEAGSVYDYDDNVRFILSSYDYADISPENCKSIIESELGSDIHYFKAEPDDTQSAKFTYPTIAASYNVETGRGTEHCLDYFVHTDSALLRIHSSVPLDFATKYHDEIGRRMESSRVE